MLKPAAVIETVTPETATEWLEKLPYEGQRPINQRRVDLYAAAMREGRWRLSSIDIARCEETERGYLVNGQHRLWAVVYAGVPVDFAVIEHQYATYAEVQEHYAEAADTHQPRTATARLASYRIDAKVGLTVRETAFAGRALGLLIDGFRRTPDRKTSSRARAEGLLEWAEEARTFLALTTRSPRALQSRLRSAPVFACALITLKFRPIVAGDFWGRVASYDGLLASSPEQTLVSWLLTTTGARLREIVTADAVGRCWNAAWRSSKLHHIKQSDLGERFTLSGCGLYEERAPVIWTPGQGFSLL